MSIVVSLLDSPLTPKQRELLTTILYPVIRQNLSEATTWSKWSFAQGTLRKSQPDADQIAASLPRLGSTSEFLSYGLIWRETPAASPNIQRREKVGLTMAGLYRADPDSADRIARLIGWCADREDALEPDPDDMPEQMVDFNAMLKDCLTEQWRAGNGSLNAQTVADVLMREPFGIQVLMTSGQWIYTVPIGHGDLIPFCGVTDAAGYLRVVEQAANQGRSRDDADQPSSTPEVLQNLAPPKSTPSEMHPIVWNAAADSWNAGLYRQAVATAGEHLVDSALRRLGRDDLSGVQVWHQAFSKDAADADHPRLRWPGSPTDRNVQNMNNGLRDFAKGVQLMIRNSATHPPTTATGQRRGRRALSQPQSAGPMD